MLRAGLLLHAVACVAAFHAPTVAMRPAIIQRPAIRVLASEAVPPLEPASIAAPPPKRSDVALAEPAFARALQISPRCVPHPWDTSLRAHRPPRDVRG